MRGSHPAVRAAVLAMALAMLFSLFIPKPASAYYTQETRMLMRIKEIAPSFGGALERMIFQRGFARIDCRKATENIYKWIQDNQFPHITLFLESLTEDDVATLIELFKQNSQIASSPSMPLFEDLHTLNQFTVLALPFKGEFYVLHGNDNPPDHLPDGPHRYAWDFIVMKKGLPFQQKGDTNEQHYVWGAAILAPAPGTVAILSQDNPDHAPSEPGMDGAVNQIVIDHGAGEQSVIRHIMHHSALANTKQAVKAGAPIARAGNNGGSEFPLIHFQLDKSKQGNRSPLQARFAVYFARDESDQVFRLVVSGIPAPGQYIMDVSTYIDAPAQ
jgi:hypothetical protein